MSVLRSILPAAAGMGLLYVVLLLEYFDFMARLVLVLVIAGGAGLATLLMSEEPQELIEPVPPIPAPVFDVAKASEGVDMVERLHKLNAENFEGSEIQFDYPGVRGKLTKGKPPVVVQAPEKKDEPDTSAGTVEPV